MYLMDQDTSKSSDHEAALLAMIDAQRVSQNAADMMDEAVHTLMGVNRTDGRCIDIVHRRGRITAGDLGREAGLTSGAVTALLDRLEKADYLHRTRDTGDRRKVYVEPTAKLNALAEAIYGQIGRVGRGSMAKMPLPQMDLITRYLRTGAYLNQELSALLRQVGPKPGEPLQNAEAFAARVSERLSALEAGMIAAWTGTKTSP
jgi:DNA-binding MarR family transcriptional regulator